MKALRKIIATEKDFEFHFIGPIPKKKQMFSERIIYHGLITDNDKMKKLLREMDVLVCPSHSEGMPNVVMEALASGLAVIATDTGATSVMVNAENGWLIRPGDEKELSAALKDAIALSNDLLTEKKKKAVELVEENFLWNKIALTTIQLLEDKLK